MALEQKIKKLEGYLSVDEVAENLQLALEVIRELQANPKIISDNSKVNADLLKENAELKNQLDRVRDSEGLAVLIKQELAKSNIYTTSPIELTQSIQNYILGGEGGEKTRI